MEAGTTMKTNIGQALLTISAIIIFLPLTIHELILWITTNAQKYLWTSFCPIRGSFFAATYLKNYFLQFPIMEIEGEAKPNKNSYLTYIFCFVSNLSLHKIKSLLNK